MAAKKRITLEDVARIAGASPGVVSSVLNGNRHKTTRVSPETQERIRQAAATLDYRPNMLARSLQRRRTQNILFASYFVGSLIDTRGSGFLVEVLDSALTTVTRHGFDLMIHLLDRTDPEKSAILGDGRADGCLWIAPAADDPFLPNLKRISCPLVIFGAKLPEAVACIGADNRQGIRLAMEYLLQLGHTRLAFVSQSMTSSDGVERREAFTEVCLENGLSPLHIVAQQTPPDESGLTSIILESLMEPLQRLDRPTAVLCYNDGIALNVMRAARTIGLSIPDDLSIVGFDSTGYCETASPPLTSVRQPLRKMSERCMTVLIEEITTADPAGAGRSEGNRIELFPCQLDIRLSTAPPGGRK